MISGLFFYLFGESLIAIFPTQAASELAPCFPPRPSTTSRSGERRWLDGATSTVVLQEWCYEGVVQKGPNRAETISQQLRNDMILVMIMVMIIEGDY